MRTAGLTLTVVLLFVGSARLLTHAQATPGPDAIAAYVEGKALVTRLDRTVEPVSPGTRLHVGDRVRVPSGAQVTVVFPDRPQQVWSGGDAGKLFTVARPSAPRGGVVGRVWRYLCSKLQPRPLLTTPAAARSAEGFVVAGLEPADSLVRGQPVVFTWEPLPQAIYTFEVLDDTGECLWRAEGLTECRATYPDPLEGAPLAPGKRFHWRVCASEPADTESALTWFEVIGPERAAEVEQALQRLETGMTETPDAVARLQRAAVLASFGLHAEARRELALVEDPDTGRGWERFVEQVAP